MSLLCQLLIVNVNLHFAAADPFRDLVKNMNPNAM